MGEIYDHTKMELIIPRGPQIYVKPTKKRLTHRQALKQNKSELEGMTVLMAIMSQELMVNEIRDLYKQVNAKIQNEEPQGKIPKATAEHFKKIAQNIARELAIDLS